MSTTKKIAKNTGVLFISQVISYLLIFFYTIYIARSLGAEGFGILSFALAFSGIFSIFADLGINTLTVREVARDKSLSNKYLGNGIIIKILLAFFSFGLIILIINLLGYNQETILVVYFVSISVILTSVSGIFNSIFQAYEKMEYTSLSQILISVLMFCGVVLAIRLGFNVVGFAIVYSITSFLTLVFTLIIYIIKFSVPKFEVDIHFWKPTIIEALFFGLSSFFISIYFYISTIMISILNGNVDVGIFSAAYRLIFVLLFIPNVVIISLFPVMSQHFESYKDLLKLEYEKTFKYLFLMAIFILIIGYIFSDKLILLVYGYGFTNAVIVLQILIFVIPLIFINTLLGNLLGASNRQRFLTIVAFSNVILNIGLNILLIPKYGYIGASIAYILTESLGFILMFTYISRYLFNIQIKNIIIKTALSGVLVTIMLYYLKMHLNWIVVCILGFLIYFLVIYRLNIINKHDFELLKQIIK
jgi:O-antigen/teichoic acid export membrane protein